MQLANIPTLFPIAWGANASGGYIRAVPLPSQVSVNPLNASFNDGWPAQTFQLGGAPDGRDANGVINMITLWNQWEQAGGAHYYNASFSSTGTYNIGGYPAGALINAAAINGGYWFSTVDNNTSNPDAGGANWLFCQISQTALDARYMRPVPAFTFYVNGSTGTDTNTGTSATVTGTYINGVPVGPFATLQGCVNNLIVFSSPSGVTINVANGTYGGCQIPQSLISSWTFIGNTGTPHLCQIYQYTVAGFSAGHCWQVLGATVWISGFEHQAYYGCGYAANYGVIYFNGNCRFIGYQLSTSICGWAWRGGDIYWYGAHYFSGNWNYIHYAGPGGGVHFGYLDFFTSITVALTYSSCGCNYHVYGWGGEHWFYPSMMTWSGNPTSGLRFWVGTGGQINTQGQGLTWIPGFSAGTIYATTYGVYV